MSIRVYLRPEFTPSGKHPQGCHYFTTSQGGAVNLNCEGGTFFFELQGFMDPIHPELRPHIARCTYRVVLTNMVAYGRLQPGTYVHGKFVADVHVDGDGRNRQIARIITAKAPTLAMLARYVRPILAGEDTPRSSARKATTQPSIDVSTPPMAIHGPTN